MRWRREMTGLTTLDVDVLAFERRWWLRPGAKDSAIRDLFKITPTDYYRRLSRLIDRPEALAHDPLLVNRLRMRRQNGAVTRRRMVS